MACSYGFLSSITNGIEALSHPKYDGEYLHKLLRERLGDKQLHHTLTNIIIPTFDVKLQEPTTFSSFRVGLYSFEFFSFLSSTNRYEYYAY